MQDVTGVESCHFEGAAWKGSTVLELTRGTCPGEGNKNAALSTFKTSISPGCPQQGYCEDAYHLNTWLPCVCLCTSRHTHFPVK